MKITKFITINNEIKENKFFLRLAFNNDNQPMLIIGNTEVVLPVSLSIVLNVLETADISSKKLINPYAIVQNEAEEFINLVLINSPEYKKIISSKSITTSKIKQGALVKLQSEERLIFLQTIKMARTYKLREIHNYFQGNTYRRNNQPHTEKEVKNMFKSYNLFLDPISQNFSLFEISFSNKRVIETYDVIPEYNKINYDVKTRFNLNNYLYLKNFILFSSEEGKSIEIDLGNNSSVLISNRAFQYSGSTVAFSSEELKPLLDFVKGN